MVQLPSRFDNSYTTPGHAASFAGRLFPNLIFYPSMLRTVGWASHLAKKGKLTSEAWVRSSMGVLSAFERVGVTFNLENLDAFINLDGPCVFVGNHMSTLETFVLPGIILPYRDVTFVVKESLTEYPFFRWIMRSTRPIAVGRQNPREDLKTVLEEGEQRLANGTSVVVFPQATRSEVLDPAIFNSIGIKLARRANVPVVPVALKTNTWGMGRMVKDFGPVNPTLPVHIRFGKPMRIEGNGKAEHQIVCNFISRALQEWNGPTQ